MGKVVVGKSHIRMFMSKTSGIVSLISFVKESEIGWHRHRKIEKKYID